MSAVAVYALCWYWVEVNFPAVSQRERVEARVGITGAGDFLRDSVSSSDFVSDNMSIAFEGSSPTGSIMPVEVVPVVSVLSNLLMTRISLVTVIRPLDSRAFKNTYIIIKYGIFDRKFYTIQYNTNLPYSLLP